MKLQLSVLCLCCIGVDFLIEEGHHLVILVLLDTLGHHDDVDLGLEAVIIIPPLLKEGTTIQGMLCAF